MTFNNAVATGGFLENYIADVGVTMMFGLGYYLFKSLKKDDNTSLSYSKDNLKNIKNKLEGALEPWQYAKNIEEYHELIESNYKGINDPFAIINLMNRNGVLPTIETYNVLLFSCLITNNDQFAEQLKDEILDPTGPVTPNVYTLNVLIKGLNMKYTQMMDKMNNPNDLEEREIFFNKFDEELISIIECLENRNIFIDVMAQNNILTALVDHGRLGDALNQFTNMKTSHNPDLYTYITLLRGIKNTKELSEDWLTTAYEIFEEAKSLYELDESFFNLLLDVCAKFNRIDKAELLFDEMKQRSGSISEYSYNLMIKGYGKLFKLEKALETFNQIKSKMTPSTNSYGAILNASIRSNDIDLAETLVVEMTSNNIEKNIYIYSTMMNGYRKTKNIEKAIELYHYLLNKLNQDTSIKLNTAFFNRILETCVDSNRYEKMKEIFNYMQEKYSEDQEFPKPDFLTYSIVIKGYCKTKDVPKVSEIYSYLRAIKNYTLDEILYNIILDFYARHKDEENVIRVFKDMKSNSVKPNVITYGILIKLYCNMSNCNKAFELFDELVKSECKPTVVVYQMLIKLQIKSNLIDNAITMFRNMVLNNIKPDNLIYELIIKSCFEYDHPKEGSEFLLGSAKDGIRLEKFVYELFINALEINSYYFKYFEKYELLGNLFVAIEEKSIKIDLGLLEKLNIIYANIHIGNKKHIQNNYQDLKASHCNKDNVESILKLSVVQKDNKNSFNKKEINSNKKNLNHNKNHKFNIQTKGNRNNLPINNFTKNSNMWEEKSIYS